MTVYVCDGQVRRIPISSIPEEEAPFKVWMQQLFVQKDAFMEPFFAGKVIPTEPNHNLEPEFNAKITDNSRFIDQGEDFNDNSQATEDASKTLDSKTCRRKSNSDTDKVSCRENLEISENGVPSYDYKALSKYYDGKISKIGLQETLPAFVVFGSFAASLFVSNISRNVYFGLLGYGTVIQYGWLAYKSVC